jgi:formyl-CoA transferase
VVSTDNASALEGLTVLDFTQAMLGPGATAVLADFGADVIKVERPRSGDLSRWAITDDPAGGNNPAFASTNRNKRSIAVDLASDEGKEVIFRLLERSDVVVNNFRPSVMTRLGLGYEQLSERFPRLIYGYASGFGSSGPYSHKGGQDILAQAMTGVMMRKSDPRHPLAIYATCLADYTGAMHLAQAIMLALLARERTGRGQFLEVSLHDSMLGMQAQEAAMALMRGVDLNWGAMPLSLVVETADAPLVLVGAFRREPLRDICAAIGAPDLSKDERFDTPEKFRANGFELRDVLQEIFLTQDRAYWLKRLEEADLLCAPVLSLDEALDGPQTQHNEMVWRSEARDGTEAQALLAPPLHLSDTPATLRYPSPDLGQHTDDVLMEAGFTAEEVARLRQIGAVS